MTFSIVYDQDQSAIHVNINIFPWHFTIKEGDFTWDRKYKHNITVYFIYRCGNFNRSRLKIPLSHTNQISVVLQIKLLERNSEAVTVVEMSWYVLFVDISFFVFVLWKNRNTIEYCERRSVLTKNIQVTI